MSREKQIEEMSTLIYENRPIKDIWNEDADSIAETLYNAGYRKQEWISVDDRLPETEGDYLVWNKEQKRIEIRFFYRLPPNYPVESHPEIREYFGNFADYKRITHWMPLPEPPKMKGGAE